MTRSLQSRASHPGTYLSSGRAWATAAFLVLAGAVALAFWLDHAAANNDRYRLERGAEAITRNLESELRVVEMAASVIVAASTAADTPADFASIAVTADPVVLNSLVGLVSYPVTSEGSGPGTAVFQVHPRNQLDIPDLGLSAKITETLIREDIPYLSPAYRVPGEDGVRMIAVVPAQGDHAEVLIGAIFLADRILHRAMAAVGEDEYAGQLLDRRFGDKVIVSEGTPTGSEIVRSSPVGMAGLIDIAVATGSAFPHSRSPLTFVAVLGLGLFIAVLLSRLAYVTRARTREVNERLELARLQDEGKDRFLATVSHELRTPLTVVVGGASEIESQWETLTVDERNELLGMVSDQAQEASNLVEDLLVVARSEYGNVKIALAETRLQRHLSYAVSSMPLGREGTLTITDEDPVVYADGTRLRQILRNLVQNAVTHGGPNISIGVSRGDGMVHISVCDDGTQLPSGDCERIFEPYARSDGAEVNAAQGIGIGLYVSRLLAQVMGGELICRCDGDWTEFRLSLPGAAAEAISVQERVSVE
ncbi:MAG: HAMP domain-containing sensor histidine kinase [Acidimicrobiia bacterium]